MNRIDRILRGPGVSRLLTGLGIDPKRYWLLMDLFGALTDRREVMSQLGRDGIKLKSLAFYYGLLIALVSLVLVMAQHHLRPYMLVFLGMNILVLLSVLIPEISNSLINPMEGLILAPQPINGATYTAAKLTHLLRILLYFVPAINLIPALVGLALIEARWYYPLEHMLVAFLVGLSLALFGCGLFGWLIRFVPTPRLRTAGQVAEFLPMLALLSGRLLARLWVPVWLAENWQAQAILVAAACLMVVLGIRSLSVDYLVRVSSIMQGRPASRKRSVRRSLVGDTVGLLFGGQPGRAGFEYTRRMMVRDWQFRRRLLPFLLMFAALFKGLKISPFSGEFSPLHFAPHLFGFVLFIICNVLAYGRDYKSAWVFLLVPGKAFGPFARGVYSALWLPLVVLPHAALLALLTWKWGWLDACCFDAYSLAVVSLYLGLELRLIDAIPFSKQMLSTQGADILMLMFVGAIVAGMFVGLQYFLLFPSRTRVAMAAFVFGCAAYLATRGSLKALQIGMRYHLGLVSSEATMLYTEVN